MSQFFVCDYCGEPISGTAMELLGSSVLGAHPVVYERFGHFCLNPCYRKALAALFDLCEANRLADSPTGGES